MPYLLWPAEGAQAWIVSLGLLCGCVLHLFLCSAVESQPQLRTHCMMNHSQEPAGGTLSQLTMSADLIRIMKPWSIACRGSLTSANHTRFPARHLKPPEGGWTHLYVTSDHITT